MMQAAGDARAVPRLTHTVRAAARVAPATSADASCMPANTGLSSVPRPKSSTAGSGSGSPACRTAAMYRCRCTISSCPSAAGAGGSTDTPAAENTPNARASSIVISTRTGAIGCQDPKS